MPEPNLYELFRDFDLQITNDEIDILYKIASNKQITIAEGIHTCFLCGLSTLLYKIRREEIAEKCCGGS